MFSLITAYYIPATRWWKRGIRLKKEMELIALNLKGHGLVSFKYYLFTFYLRRILFDHTKTSIENKSAYHWSFKSSWSWKQLTNTIFKILKAAMFACCIQECTNYAQSYIEDFNYSSSRKCQIKTAQIWERYTLLLYKME